MKGRSNQEMVETLWPYGGFAVRASERKLGEGRLTLTNQSLFFQAKNGAVLGFDFLALRLIRLIDPSNVELVYSIQNELRNASLKVAYTFPGGTGRDELPSEEDPYRMSLFRAISGGVVARFLIDHSNSRIEGLTKLTDEKFESRMEDLDCNISLFPSKREIDEDVFWDEDLRKRSLEVAESEPAIWDDPYRERIYYTGTDPGMTTDNAFQKLDILREDWVNGRLTPLQRARCAAMNYKIDMRMYVMGYPYQDGESPNRWKEAAERLAQFERGLGLDVANLIGDAHSGAAASS